MNEPYQKRGYLLEDFRLFHLRDSQGTRVDYHYHEFCKLLLLLSGTGSYVVEGKRYLLTPGDLVLIDSHCVHRPEFEPNRPYERIIIYISPAFLDRCSSPDCDLAECFDRRWGHVLRLEEAERRNLFNLAAGLERELSGSEYGRVILSSCLLLRLLVEIGRNLRRTDLQQPDPILPKNDRILGILRYIDGHLTEDLSVDALAEHFYISKYHMMRSFRSETGASIHSYITERRLILARELISQGMSATESCFRSGFRSYSSFTRAYGKHFGATPTGRRDPAARLAETYE